MQCNRDCFNCIFEDCIVNELLPEDLKEINQRDREIRRDNKDNKRKKIAERQRKYREEHRDEIDVYMRQVIEIECGRNWSMEVWQIFLNMSSWKFSYSL